MPASNDSRVRRDGFSNITATDCGPASGRWAEPVGLHLDGQVEHRGLLGRR